MKADATAPRATDRLLRFWMGRDWMVRDGWRATLLLLPMRSLMNRVEDEGRHILVALGVEFGFRRPLQRFLDSGDGVWRPYLQVWSDADEITRRRAGLA